MEKQAGRGREGDGGRVKQAGRGRKSGALRGRVWQGDAGREKAWYDEALRGMAKQAERGRQCDAGRRGRHGEEARRGRHRDSCSASQAM